MTQSITETNMDNILTGNVIGAAIEVHREIGPGLFESTYEQCLAHELKTRGISFQLQVQLPVRFKDLKLECGYRADFLIEEKLILELKSIEQIINIHETQILTYMKHANVKLGLIINFNVASLKSGIKRYIL